MVIPNGFDTEEFRPDPQARAKIRNTLGLSDRTHLISMIANASTFKDHETFFKAAQTLAQDGLEVRFLLAGQGLEKTNAAMATQVAALGLGEWTYLLGERRDIPALLAASDIATLSSFEEAFPNVVGEAMACALPCVATDVGDVRRIVEDTGVVVPPKDSEALAAGWRKLLKMTREERICMGWAARDRIIREYSIQKVVQRYQQLYESLVNTDVLAADQRAS